MSRTTARFRPVEPADGPLATGALTLALPRGAIVVQPPPPLWITRLNCAEVLGLEADQFDRFCRERWLPGERRGRTWIVPYEGARRALDGAPPASKAVAAP